MFLYGRVDDFLGLEHVFRKLMGKLLSDPQFDLLATSATTGNTGQPFSDPDAQRKGLFLVFDEGPNLRAWTSLFGEKVENSKCVARPGGDL